MAELVETHISSTTIFTSQDGSEALLKLDNAPPHVLMIDPNISKASGWQVVSLVLENKKFKETANTIMVNKFLWF